MNKKLNIGYLMIGVVIMGLLMLISIAAAFEESEGTMGSNPIWIFFAKLFYILILPLHNRYWSIEGSGIIIVFGGYLFVCLIYGLLIERALTIWTVWKKKE